MKRVQVIPVEINSIRTINLRFDYVRRFSEIIRLNPSIVVVYLDGSGFNLHLTCPYGRSRVGTSPISEVPSSSGKNLSLMQAITKEEVLYCEVLKGGVNAITFEQFLVSLIKKVDVENTIIVLDNARI